MATHDFAMAAAGASSAVSEDVDLLYPELMSSKAIVKILKEREYRDTRSGRALSALRERADSRRKRKASHDASSDSSPTKVRKGSQSRSQNDDDKGRRRPSDPPAKRDRKSGTASSGGEWGSWDEEGKSKSTKVGSLLTFRCA
ncbi:hypothetical protein HPB50_012601 [Hyalomma asiaticum]|uniref:Uncharacterized protein n=1 Tax=Hyalomma asiaticum TaxID=266040 RepID=A0ACB7S0H3_HYAAI|nr:hypothetical protein HPB50_012601 [Hyalomma asiaticum]